MSDFSEFGIYDYDMWLEENCDMNTRQYEEFADCWIA